MRQDRSTSPQLRGLSRRTLLKTVALAGGALAVGCGRELTLVEGTPRPRSAALDSAVDHIVVLMLENRSFDHYFGALATDPAYPGRAQVDGIRTQFSNCTAAGTEISTSLRGDPFTDDPPHDWDTAHRQFNQGRNDGFVTAAQSSKMNNPLEVMSGYDRSHLPVLYALADQYTVCDRYFASVMGPTWPNRFFLHATTSWGERGYGPNLNPNAITVWDLLRSTNHEAKHYFAGGVSWYSGGFLAKTILGGRSGARPAHLREFFRDARDGTLPEFSVIDPDFGLSDDHPPHDIRLGQAFVGTVVQAIADSPNWAKTLLVVTYDEHGGFFDHVAPPAVDDDRASFQQLGFRVPAVLVGPMVRAGHVESTPFDHASIASTLGARFALPSLTVRMGEAEDFGCAIDPAFLSGQAPALDRPKLPTVTLEKERIEATLGRDSQPELTALAPRLPPEWVDPRSARERGDEWLKYAQHFEVLRVID